MKIEADQASDLRPSQPDTRVRWQGHVKAAITDLRNSDRSPFEQQVYDVLRLIDERQQITG